MVKFILFDTETTGLPRDKYKSALIGPDNWPDIVSICWMLFEGHTLIKKVYHIIKPKGWKIPLEASKIHGITDAIAEAKGVPLQDVMDEFRTDIKDSYRIIAHNLEFDKNVVFGAYKWHLGIDPLTFWPVKAEFCTAQVSKWEMKLPSRYPNSSDPYKFPSLGELYKDTFKVDAPSGAHNAERDVDVLQAIVWARWYN
jgi:DNA polymerase III epsilon subunit-like protein